MEPRTTIKAMWRKFHIKPRDILPRIAYFGTRNDLAVFFAELGFTEGAEIGVREGFYSEILCKANPNLHLLCVDPWEVYGRADPRHISQIYDAAKNRLSQYNCTLIPKRSLEAVKEIPIESLDFVYIDGLHEFNSVMLDLIYWTDRVKIGGVVAGHDYVPLYQCGVMKALDAFCAGNNIFDYIILKDPQPSWAFVKYDRQHNMEWIVER